MRNKQTASQPSSIGNNDLDEIGPFPEGWETVTIGGLEDAGVLRVQNGFPCGDHNLDGNGIGHLRPFNVAATGRLDLSVVKFIPDSKDTTAYVLKHGDIIFNNTNSEELVGKTGLYEGDNGRYVLSNHMTYMRVIGDKVDRRFLAAYIHKRWFDGYYRRICRRHVNQASISKDRIRHIAVPLPPLPEQRAIAHVLSRIQAAAQAQAAIAKRARELKRALMAKLFTEGLRGEALKEAEIGLMPESWGVASLGECLILAQYGLSVRGGEYGKYPILRMTNQQSGRIVADKLQYVDIDESVLRKFRLKPGELLFNRTNSIDLVGRTALFDLPGDFVFASYLIRLAIAQNKLEPSYINSYLGDETVQARLKGLATRGVSQSNISASRLKTFVIPLPPLDEQREIARALQAVDAKIAAAERKQARLEELFRAMLGELMTGRVRAATGI